MRIVFITSRFPFPLEKGDKLRAYHQIRHLSVDNEVHLIALNHGEVPPEHRHELMKFCRSVSIYRIGNATSAFYAMMALLQGLPMQTGWFYRPWIRRKTEQLIRAIHPDAVICQLLRTARYVERTGKSSILDFQDCFSAGMFRRAEKSSFLNRWFFRLEGNLLSCYEEKCQKRFDASTVISANDRNLFNFDSKNEIRILPNGVDTNYFRASEGKKEFELLFTGNLSYPPNVDAAGFLAAEILPELRRRGQDISLLLAGANPSASIRGLESPKVRISGWMDDIREAYSSARIFVAPMRLGTGLQNKLLEAMSMGMPCICSTLANQGLEAKAGEEILIGDSAAEIAEHINYLIANPEAASQLAAKGRSFVESRYSWESGNRILSTILEEISQA